MVEVLGEGVGTSPAGPVSEVAGEGREMSPGSEEEGEGATWWGVIGGTGPTTPPAPAGFFDFFFAPSCKVSTGGILRI